MPRTIAIDWSGAKVGARSKIFLAEVRGGRLVRLESGRDRTEVVDHVIELVAHESDLIVGFDFAFSLPRWFIDQLGAETVDELWAHVAEAGEGWLDECRPPFWGRPGRRKPDLAEHFRLTEAAASGLTHSTPKSVFQIGGAGAVGTGSLRGMPHLGRLTREGFSIWPFEETSMPLAVEIYPRLLTGAVTKSSQRDREAFLSDGYPEIGPELLRVAASSEDAFDAAVSAVVMDRHRDELASLRQTANTTERLEGAIWWPAETRAPAPSPARVRTAHPDCPFCSVPRAEVLAESAHAVAVRDRYPVSPGHVLVVPRTHEASVFDLPPSAQADVWRLVADVQADLTMAHDPDGFNVGVNDGRAAGQTISHAHVHVIPRYRGDVADPRGGIRWVVPERAPYWET